MSGYRRHSAPQAMLFGYDPVRDLPADHLARLVEAVVNDAVKPPLKGEKGGQPAYDPRLCLKVLLYGYCTGLRSSRRLEQNCRESLPYLFLTRGDTPSYRTLCYARVHDQEQLAQAWEGLFAIAAEVGLKRVGKVVIDSTKIRADVSSASVVSRIEFDAVRAELERCLAEAAAADAAEEEAPVATQTGKKVAPDQVRDVLRRVRQQRRQAGLPAEAAAETAPAPKTPVLTSEAPALPLEDLPLPLAPAAAPLDPKTFPKPLRHLAAAMLAIQTASAAGESHVSLTDAEARLMNGGVERRTQPCYSWEVAVDTGLLVAHETTQSGNDNDRLEPLVTAARAHEPDGLTSVTGDSGYFSGDAVGKLAREGLDLCVPDCNTAGDLHRGQPVGTIRAKSQGKIAFEYDAEANVFRCPEGNTLRPHQQRRQCGQKVQIYRAERECAGCPLAGECLVRPNAKHRRLQRGEYEAELVAARERFNQREHQTRYRARGPAVETVFGFLRTALGFRRWSLRGKKRVAAEGEFFALAYQFRKIHKRLQAAAG
jgi:transposase